MQLKAKAGFLLEGEFVRAGQLVEVIESDAKQLIRAGVAEVHKVVDEVRTEVSKRKGA
jgi:hypothetical protein